MKVLAFDPGETTGICYLDSEDLSSFRVSLMQPDEIYAWAALSDIPFRHPDLWVVENFRLYAHKSQTLINNEMIPCRVIGALEVLSRRLGKKIHYQMAAEAKPFVSDARLKDFGLYTLNDHSRDATRHALYFLLKKGYLDVK